MGVFYHEDPPNHTKRCKFLVEALKEVFSSCQTFGARLSTSSFEDEYPVSDFDDEEVFISAVISRTIEKQKQKPSVMRHSFSWLYSPATKELYVTQAMTAQAEERVKLGDQQLNEAEEEFMSVKSCFSRCSSSPSAEALYSVKTNLSRCSSLNDLDLSKYWKRSVIQEFRHCDGWPFGLCRRAVLLPPLPKSPSESWLSRKLNATKY